VNRLPGVALCAAIAAAAWVVQRIETAALGFPFIEAVLLAIVLGALVRATIPLPPTVAPGVAFAGQQLLEVAVLLLGASMNAEAIAAAGPLLLTGIVVIVAASLVATYTIARALGLGSRMAVLLACGTSICGNSAIVAVAPVIEAEPEEVASAIAFTAVVGVALVLALPLAGRAIGVSPVSYGVVAGLTVYAVPQVLAATWPLGPIAGSTGTLVKLLRVLLLGPTVVAIALLRHRSQRIALHRMVPWFVVGFLLLAAMGSAGLIPARVAAASRAVASVLTVMAMAALGLGVDVGALRRAGPRAMAAVAVSLVLLLLMSVGLAAITTG
jgi:uncharacterized integral membrane protein (TIGR00698 family)